MLALGSVNIDASQAAARAAANAARCTRQNIVARATNKANLLAQQSRAAEAARAAARNTRACLKQTQNTQLECWRTRINSLQAEIENSISRLTKMAEKNAQSEIQLLRQKSTASKEFWDRVAQDRARDAEFFHSAALFAGAATLAVSAQLLVDYIMSDPTTTLAQKEAQLEVVKAELTKASPDFAGLKREWLRKKQPLPCKPMTSPDFGGLKKQWVTTPEQKARLQRALKNESQKDFEHSMSTLE